MQQEEVERENENEKIKVQTKGQTSPQNMHPFVAKYANTHCPTLYFG